MISNKQGSKFFMWPFCNYKFTDFADNNAENRIIPMANSTMHGFCEMAGPTLVQSDYIYATGVYNQVIINHNTNYAAQIKDVAEAEKKA